MVDKKVHIATIYMFGGLGNILFQLAAAKYLQDNGRNVIVNNSLTRSNIFTRTLKWTIHDNFELISEDLNQFEISHKIGVLDLIYLVRVLISKRYFNSSKFDDLSLNNQRYLGYFQKILVSNTFLDSYLLSVADSLKAKLNANLVSACVVHHRSQESDWSGQSNALERFGVSVDKFLIIHVLTDDVLSARRIYMNETVYNISRGELIDDLSRMTYAKCFLGAASTLSFWACLMNSNEVYIDIAFLKDKLPVRLLNIGGF